jgi:iron(III) transport system ATP-binding protein
MKDLRLVNLRKLFGEAGKETVAVDNVDLEVEKGQLVTLLGPSGCGKTTLLRMIAGFEDPTAGDIYFGERRVNDDPPNARNAAMVFQSYAIFPHLNVFENVAFGLRLKHIPRADIRRRVGHALTITGLSGMATRRPDQLSGGQQQRVALARCIVTEPGLLLFDEPLSNLDAKLREQMRLEIRELQQRLGISTIYVTHDQIEAMSMSDLIVVMNSGKVEQIGSPLEIYGTPRSRFVADFVGKANFLEGVVVDATHVRVADGILAVEPHDKSPSDRATLVLRPESLAMDGNDGVFQGTIRRAVFLGNTAEYLVHVENIGDLLVEQNNPMKDGLRQVGSSTRLTPLVTVVVSG